jgi:amino acid adenylation domain-containing protein
MILSKTLIPSAISTLAATTPDALAIRAPDDILTYAELDTRAGHLADRLHDLGVGPDAVVAVCLPRSAAFIVATLAILKSGAAYMPVDPSSPAERLAFMLTDCGPRAIIVDPAAGHPIPDGPWAEIDVREAAIPLGSGARQHDVVKDEHLAYVIYTSGSTGQPKGVEVTHGSLANLVAWHQRAFEVAPGTRAHLYASPAFDAAVWETWPYLTAGASVHLPPDAVRVDPEALRDWMLAERITIGFVPTPVAERLLGLAWPASTPLRTLLTGADTLHRYPPATLPFALVNNYGPTECTVVTTSGIVGCTPMPDALPSIGRAVDNVEVLVLDDASRPVAPGTAGELHIGGAGLARGYRHRPDLTAERFVPHPTVAGARLYRTGDRARLLPDGSVAFLGRLDDQVKIRGYRVELNEVVAALGTHPGIEAGTVVARESDDGERQLVAYVVPAPGVTLGRDALMSTLRRALPDYMVPAVYVTVPALSMTTNGKVDRAALPAPDADNTLRETTAAVAPRTEVETEVAHIVGALLGVDDISMDDNFFLLGGHSLLGTQLIMRLRDAFGVELALRTLFDAPTIAELATEIERARLERAA